MWSQRARVDYALQRRATLASLFTGLTTTTDVCDPDPYTLRAAKHHGEATDRVCPVCRRETLVELNYTFGDELGQYSGRLEVDRPSSNRWRASTPSSASTSSRSARAAGGTTWWSRSSSVMGSPASGAGGGAPPSSRATEPAESSPDESDAVNLHLPRPDYPRIGEAWRPPLPAVVAPVAGAVRVGVRSPAHRVRLGLFAGRRAHAGQPAGAGAAECLLLQQRQDGPGPGRRHRPVLVVLDDLPVTTRQAVLAAEDRGFYKHGGVSPKGLARAVWNDARGGSLQGGSTITQQLVKNYYLTQQRTLSRKVNELVLSLKIERRDARTRSSRTTSTPSTTAAAPTASRPRRGSTSACRAQPDPRPGRGPRRDHPQSPAATPRRPTWRGSRAAGPTSSTAWSRRAGSSCRAPGRAVPARSIDRRPAGTFGGTEGYLIAETRKELVALGFSEERIDHGGLRVVTTYNAKDQQAAADAVAASGPTRRTSGSGLGLRRYAATGGVLAMYGGRDYVTQPYNDATQSAPQAGSTFKPFALAAALEDGIGLSSMWDGHSPPDRRDA